MGVLDAPGDFLGTSGSVVGASWRRSRASKTLQEWHVETNSNKDDKTRDEMTKTLKHVGKMVFYASRAWLEASWRRLVAKC